MKALFLLAAIVLAAFTSTAHNNVFLGVEWNHVSASKAKKLGFETDEGRYLTRVLPGTAAARAGLQPFDYLLGFNDQLAESGNNVSNQLHRFSPGDEATIQLVREGQKMSLPVTFGSHDDPKVDDPTWGTEFLGVAPGHNTVREGVALSYIVENSAAEAMGMQKTDAIAAINNWPTLDWHDVSTAINNIKPEEPVAVTVIRDGARIVLSGFMGYHKDVTTKTTTIRAQTGNDSIIINDLVVTTDEAPNDTPTDSPVANNPPIGNDPATNMEVSMETLTQEEVDAMKDKYGIDMPVENDLTIDQLQLFPNPNRGMFNLAFDVNSAGPTTIQIFNSGGQLVYNKSLSEFSGPYQDQVDISMNRAGIYFLQVVQNGKTLNRKVVVK